MAGGVEISGRTLVLLLVAAFAAIAAFLHFRAPGSLPKLDVAGAAVDREHAIPTLNTYDAVVESDRAVRLGMVIATPLRDDAKSRARLDRKFGLYRDYFHSAQFRQKYGAPAHGRSIVYVRLHRLTDRGMKRRVDEHLEKLRAAGIDARLELID